MDLAFRVSIPDKDMRFMSFLNGPDLFLDPPSLLFKGYTMGIFPGIKQNGREAHHSPLSSDEVKNEWSYTASPQICLRGLHRVSPFWIEYVYIFLIIKQIA